MKHIRDAVILIVDDKEENLAALVAALGDDYEVSVACDGESALETIDIISPDLILLDVVMPEMDGFEVCRRLKADTATSAIPVLFLTSLSDSAAKTRAFAAGAVDYITKPFDIAEVRARVHTHLVIYLMGLELEEQKERAVENAKMKAEFLATMSHEIRTPLNGILGMTQLLLETSLTSKQLELTQTISDSGNSLLTIINNILDNSKLEAGKLELENIAFQPRKLVESVRVLLAGRVAEKGLHLYVEVDNAVPAAVIGDPNRIRQVLMNLLGNAIKFTQTGFICISLVLGSEGMLFFSVTDTGIGIRKEDRKRLFKEFSQVDSSISRKYGGTGLGLAICKKIVTVMQGKIGVKSELGKGSEFWFEIPAEAAEYVCEDETPENKIVLSLPKLKVLIADDNEVNREVLRGMLNDNYHDISMANNGHEALQACQEHLYDIVLMDMHMPDMNGIVAVDQIRSLSGSQGRVPIIGVTASALSADRDRCLDAGMDGYITKPIVQDVLIREIARVIKSGVKAEFKETRVAKELEYFDSEQLRNIDASLTRESAVRVFKEFVKNVRSFELAIKADFRKYDATKLLLNVHKLKGAALNLGMNVLSDISEKIESLCGTEDWSGIRYLVIEMGVVIKNTLREAEIIYPELSSISENEIDSIFLNEYSFYKFEGFLLRLRGALADKSFEEYESIANSLFNVHTSSSWGKELRKVDALAFREEFEQAQSIVSGLLERLSRYKQENRSDSLNSVLLNLKKALQLSKPREIVRAVAGLNRIELPENISEMTEEIVAKINMYKYKEAVKLLEECLRKL